MLGGLLFLYSYHPRLLTFICCDCPLMARDVNLLGSIRLTQGKVDRQDAVLIVGRDLVGIDRLGKVSVRSTEIW